MGFDLANLERAECKVLAMIDRKYQPFNKGRMRKVAMLSLLQRWQELGYPGR